MPSAAKPQTKIPTRQTKAGEYTIYRAGLEWDLTDPIVIESSDASHRDDYLDHSAAAALATEASPCWVSRRLPASARSST
jgi:hypothetical protein